MLNRQNLAPFIEAEFAKKELFKDYVAIDTLAGVMAGAAKGGEWPFSNPPPSLVVELINAGAQKLVNAYRKGMKPDPGVGNYWDKMRSGVDGSLHAQHRGGTDDDIRDVLATLALGSWGELETKFKRSWIPNFLTELWVQGLT